MLLHLVSVVSLTLWVYKNPRKISNNKFEWQHPEVELYKMNKKDIQSDMDFKMEKEK